MRLEEIIQSRHLGEPSDNEVLVRIEEQIRDQAHLETAKNILGEHLSSENIQKYKEVTLVEQNQTHPNYQIIQRLFQRISIKNGGFKNKSDPDLSRDKIDQQFRLDVINSALPKYKPEIETRALLNPKIREDLDVIGSYADAVKSFADNLVKILGKTANIERVRGTQSRGFDNVFRARCSGIGSSGEYRILFTFGANNKVVVFSVVRRNVAYDEKQLNVLEARYRAMKAQFPQILK